MSIKMFIFTFLFLLLGIFLTIQAEKNQIQVIVFDFGSVIAKTDKQQLAHYLSQSLNISEEEGLQSLQQLKEHTTKDPSKDDEDEFWKGYAKNKGINLPSAWFEKFDAVKVHALREIPGMTHLVKKLQQKGYKTALLSNVRGSQAALKAKKGYYSLFSPLLFSFEIGYKKPDPEVYRVLLARLQVAPQHILFIDNKPANVKAAKELGMDGIVFVSADQLIKELKMRGIDLSEPRGL